MAFFVVLTTFAALLGSWTSPANAITPDCVPAPGTKQQNFGGLYNDRQTPVNQQSRPDDLGYTGDGCDKHHMPAAAAYDDAKAMPGGPQNLDKKCGPAILMDPADHDKTASNDKAANSHPTYPFGKDPDIGLPFTSASQYRQKQAQLIKDGRFQDAFQMDVDDIHRKFGSKYDQNILAAQNAISRMTSCNQNLPPSGGQGTGGATTQPTPSTVAAGSTVTVGATGSGSLPSGVSAGDSFDLRFADSQQLMQNPTCVLSPMILTSTPVAISATGSILPVSVRIGPSVYWEVTEKTTRAR